MSTKKKLKRQMVGWMQLETVEGIAYLSQKKFQFQAHPPLPDRSETDLKKI